MKNVLFIVFFFCCIYSLLAQQFTIPAGAELIESTEFKNNGIPYIIEQRYRLPSGEILYAYYDIEGNSSVTIQRIEQAPILAIGTDINIPGLPGYREFNFGDDRRKLVQFMKLFRLGQPDYRRIVRTPSLSDRIFTPRASGRDRDEFKLLLDLFDETWTLEHRYTIFGEWVHWDTTEIIHVNRFSD
jgi:hypothetical protein